VRYVAAALVAGGNLMLHLAR